MTEIAPYLSIIVPTLNESGALPVLRDSLQPQRNADWELIAVDGGSTDGTIGLLESFADRIETTRAQRASQMNVGARVARGKVLLFLHADTLLPGDFVAQIRTVLGLDGHGWGRFDVRLSGSGWGLRMIENSMNLRSRLTGIATGDQAMFVSRLLFDAVCGFPNIALMEDIALSSTLRRHHRPSCLKTRVTTSSRRWQRHGILTTVLLMWRLRLAYALGADPRRLAERYRQA